LLPLYAPPRLRHRNIVRGGRPAFTIVELLVACTMLGLLVGLLLPAIESSREAARRMDCANRLRQIGIAVQEHHEARRAMPVGWTTEASGASAYGWFVALLPFVEANSIRATIDTTLPVMAATNFGATQTSLSLTICPSDIQEPRFALYEEVGPHALGGQRSENILLWLASANYLGIFGSNDPDDVPGETGNGALIQHRAIHFCELERGLSETLIVSERTGSKCASAWIGFAINGEDGESRVSGMTATAPNRADSDESEFSSRHPGGANFLWADGHVALITDSIDTALYRRLGTRGAVDK
jgi:prepilin-type processing-associated H-X9-DG protein